MVRVGSGYDIHPLIAGRRLVLGGETIPHGLGLGGHSDADVLLHAVADALLGAAALEDLGTHFPPGDPSYADADSRSLLREVMDKVRGKGWIPVNVDSTIIAQAPRLAPYLPAMRLNIAGDLRIAPDRVSVKAASPEGLGALGNEKGIAAQAVVLLETL